MPIRADKILGQPAYVSGSPNHGAAAPDNRGLFSPAGLFARDGLVYVADAGNHRVLQFGDTDVPVSDIHIEWAVQPASAWAGEPFGAQPVLRVLEYGELLTGFEEEVTLSIVPNTGSSTAVLTGGAARFVGGVATFTAAALSKAGGAYRLAAGCGALPPSLSEPFDVLGRAPVDVAPGAVERMIVDSMEQMGSNRPKVPWIIDGWALPVPPSELSIAGDVEAGHKVLLSLRRVDIEDRIEAAGGYRRTPYKTTEMGWHNMGREVYDLLLPLYEFAKPIHVELGGRRDGLSQPAWTPPPGDPNRGRLYFGLERSFKPGSVRVYVDGTRITEGFTLDHENGCVTFLSPLDASLRRVTLDYVWWPRVVVAKLAPNFQPGHRESVTKPSCTLVEIPWEVE